MARSRLGSTALGLILTLAVVAVSHELTYLAAHGAGDGYRRAMTDGGHEPYWGGFLLATVVAVVALAIVAATQFLRLRSLAGRVRRQALVVRDARPIGLVRLAARAWLRLTVAATMTFVLQENLERVAGGDASGLGVIVGHHAVALPIVVLVSLVTALVVALYRWRRDVLLAIIGRAHRARRPAIRSAGPRHRTERPARVDRGGRAHGLRAPPAGALPAT